MRRSKRNRAGGAPLRSTPPDNFSVYRFPPAIRPALRKPASAARSASAAPVISGSSRKTSFAVPSQIHRLRPGVKDRVGRKTGLCPYLLCRLKCMGIPKVRPAKVCAHWRKEVPSLDRCTTKEMGHMADKTTMTPEQIERQKQITLIAKQNDAFRKLPLVDENRGKWVLTRGIQGRR